MAALETAARNESPKVNASYSSLKLRKSRKSKMATKRLAFMRRENDGLFKSDGSLSGLMASCCKLADAGRVKTTF